MNEILAKELKEAGFPQEYHDCVGDRDGNCVCQVPLTFPTLSELVDACGDEFGELIRCNMSTGLIEWKSLNNDFIGREGYGKTSEEAVAKLWLVLNKK